MDAPLDLKKAVHPKGGGGLDLRQVKQGVGSSNAPVTAVSPKKKTGA